jgi:hypothetical protein
MSCRDFHAKELLQNAKALISQTFGGVKSRIALFAGLKIPLKNSNYAHIIKVRQIIKDVAYF